MQSNAGKNAAVRSSQPNENMGSYITNREFPIQEFLIKIFIIISELTLANQPEAKHCKYIWAPSRENLSSVFATRVDSNRPAQPEKLGRGLKFGI